MAKYRMVPDDTEEAVYIRDLISADIAAKMGDLAKDRALLRKRLNWEANWQGIADSLAEEEGETIESAQSKAAARTQQQGGDAKATKPATTKPTT